MKNTISILAAILAGSAVVCAPWAQAQTGQRAHAATIAAVDAVPTFDTRPSCADAASEFSVTRTTASCQQSEQQARDTLAAQWKSFPAAERRNCVAETNVGGFPSYVQILVCLELARDARAMNVN